MDTQQPEWLDDETVDRATGEIVPVIPAGSRELVPAEFVIESLAQIDKALAQIHELSDPLAQLAIVTEAKQRSKALEDISREVGLQKEIVQSCTSRWCDSKRARGLVLRGMMKNVGGNPNLFDAQTGWPSTYDELGISRFDAHQEQKVAALPDEKYRAFKAEKLEDYALSWAALYRYAQNVLDLAPLMSSESAEWYTTPDILEAVAAVMGAIDLDPCSNSHETPNVPATSHFTKDDDGLSQDWFGRVYMNPPYGSEIPHWIDKIVLEYLEGRMQEGIVLVPARPDTQWFRALRDFDRCFMFGRVRFNDHENSAPFPTMLVNIGCDRRRFFEVMSDLGDVYRRVTDDTV